MENRSIRRTRRINLLTTEAVPTSASRLPLILALVVGAALLPSITLLALARVVHVAKAEAQPYASGINVDRDQAARAALTATGFRFHVALAGLRLTAQVNGGRLLDAAQLELYRPDDPAADRVLPWPDQRVPLSVMLDRPGRWRVRLSGVIDGSRIRVVDTAVEATPPNTPSG